ncbi:uncharacterized protein DUF4167 [Hephaestia caeni]|uniref:Uncharacterized protein DUF4167 n=2 Tax=Hephaestia caeni TaxID=645617 RepID=A0A397P8L1_9SPHN|nr:uncharacterized protein DUF4167 [Hephaestia caeni]
MNNRQAGRRRGRGGQRSQGNPQGGNRIDNRARGNANQLYEKYKNLARDAQMQGDRVNTEYYLQFADHYFRVLNENRSRVEEHQRRQRDEQDDDNDVEDDGEEQRADDQRRSYRRPQDDEGERQDRRPARGGRDHRGGDNDDDRGDAVERPQPAAPAPVAESAQEDAAPPPRRRGRPRREPAAVEGEASDALDADRLPPAIATEPVEEKPRRRRGRPPASETLAAE